MPYNLESATLYYQKEGLCYERNLCLLHMPQEILLRKAMEITSQELQLYYSLKNFNSANASINEDEKQLSINCSRSKICRYSVEEMEKRLMKLEDETEAMKKTFIETLEERKMLVYQIHNHFQRIHHRYCLGKQVMHFSLNVDSSKHAVMETGLSQILIEDSNPRILNRDHRANIHICN